MFGRLEILLTECAFRLQPLQLELCDVSRLKPVYALLEDPVKDRRVPLCHLPRSQRRAVIPIGFPQDALVEPDAVLPYQALQRGIIGSELFLKTGRQVFQIKHKEIFGTDQATGRALNHAASRRTASHQAADGVLQGKVALRRSRELLERPGQTARQSGKQKNDGTAVAHFSPSRNLSMLAVESITGIFQLLNVAMSVEISMASPWGGSWETTIPTSSLRLLAIKEPPEFPLMTRADWNWISPSFTATTASGLPLTSHSRWFGWPTM